MGSALMAVMIGIDPHRGSHTAVAVPCGLSFICTSIRQRRQQRYAECMRTATEILLKLRKLT
jgi:hypothetical protein